MRKTIFLNNSHPYYLNLQVKDDVCIYCTIWEDMYLLPSYDRQEGKALFIATVNVNLQRTKINSPDNSTCLVTRRSIPLGERHPLLCQPKDGLPLVLVVRSKPLHIHALPQALKDLSLSKIQETLIVVV